MLMRPVLFLPLPPPPFASLLEQSRNRHEPLAATLRKAEDSLLLQSPSSGSNEVLLALAALREEVAALREVAREEAVSAVLLRYLDMTGACVCVCVFGCVWMCVCVRARAQG